MGYDWSNLQVFAGGDNARSVRADIIECLSKAFPCRVTNEEEATRSIVVGPVGRWIFVGDTAGSTERADPIAFDDLAIELSKVSPTMSVKMSDSAVVHFLLHTHGHFVDKFGNGKFPCYRFKSVAEAAPFRGDIDKWAPYLITPELAQDLRAVWSQYGDAGSIVEDTGRLFGVDPHLIDVGYSIFDEADEIKYTDWLAEEPVELHMFDEYHLIVETQTK